jgi:hypothetical protein
MEMSTNEGDGGGRMQGVLIRPMRLPVTARHKVRRAAMRVVIAAANYQAVKPTPYPPPHL